MCFHVGHRYSIHSDSPKATYLWVGGCVIKVEWRPYCPMAPLTTAVTTIANDRPTSAARIATPLHGQRTPAGLG